ncbi:MAG: DUF853 domain-containing protein [Clostridium sp.]|nr:DUF853 domain-containing protein [Clostridium sp.]
MYLDDRIWMASDGDEKLSILPEMMNRHGLIAGATGTGKTITLKVMAEALSDAGVPVFLADVKGDLAGMCMPGEDSDDMRERIARFGLEDTGFRYQSYPVCYWDLAGEYGLPLHTTVSEMGPLLMGRLLRLTDLQCDLLQVMFRIADEEGLLILDTKDLRAMLQYMGENSKELSSQYGNMSRQSINAILRAVIALESQGGDKFFGEPALNIFDWIKKDSDGRGVINILDSRLSISNPMLYSTFMLWLMSDLFEKLPERGDVEKPEMVFFFDEAHLLFNNASPLLLEKIEQLVKLIRSKGVGIYFITQSPSDIPDSVLAQLGNRIQHALRAYTPAEQKKIRAAAQSFRINPDFNTEEVLSQLGIGEALVSFLDETGTPGIVERAKILPPQSKMGTISDTVRKGIISSSPLLSYYSEMVDRDSAYEFFQRQREEADRERAEEEARIQEEKEARIREREEEKAAKEKARQEEREAREKAREEEKARREEEREKAKYKNSAKTVAKSAAGTVGREVGKTVGKTVGGTFGKTLGGNVGASLARGILDTLFKR